MKKSIFLILISLFTVGEVFAQWTNPFSLRGEWEKYGIGDPYILKYRGTYYLYCSTRDGSTGVKCWASKDLINWGEAYTCSTDPITRGAYAPEVVYWNGTFYMYTSPEGNGHYVLVSQSPTGPFKRHTGNFGKTIDGSVFIEDDGKWYFYHAESGGGIQGCTMSSPTSVDAGKNIGATMRNDWTEGPTVIKRNGTYYIIYTGNHVISKGYRIDYAKNNTGPLDMYTPQAKQNPVLLNAEGPIVGLGHGSAFIGPDLDSYYYTYHNLAGDFGVGPYRRFNYDRIAWNGDKMTILGPTYWKQQGPEAADFADFFERQELGSNWTLTSGNWGITDNDFLYQDNNADETRHKALSTAATGGDYTAEFTLREKSKSNEKARFGIVFGYADEQNYGTAVVSSYSKQLEISFCNNGTWSEPVTAKLPAGFISSAWHSMRIEKSGDAHKFFIDGMLKATLTNSLTGGKVGYMTVRSQADFGYIAFSNKVDGSGIFDIYKPIPGTIEAVHYNSGGEGVAYHDLTPGNAGGKYIRRDDVDVSDCTEGGHAIAAIEPGEWYKYNVNVRAQMTAKVALKYASTTGATIKISSGNNALTDAVTLPATNGAWRTRIVGGLNLAAGHQTLKIEAVSGEFELYTMQFEEASNTPQTLIDNFDNGFANWYYTDGNWSIQTGRAYGAGYGKRSIGDAGWTDYTVEVDVTYANEINGGLLLRARNLALGANGTSAQAGSDFLQGYFVSLAAGSVILGKQNYNWKQLASAPGSYSKNTPYALKATVVGDNIKVYVDNKLVIDYTDPDPFIGGRAGLRVHNANVYFDNFRVTLHDNDPTGVAALPVQNNVNILFDPATNMLSVGNIAGFSDFSIFKIDGQQIQNGTVAQEENNLKLNIGKYTNGVYLLKLTGADKAVVVRKFVKN